MKSRKKNNLKYWLFILVAATSIALISLHVYASYTKTNRAKTVVARYGTVETRFSSNYLMHDMGDMAIYISEGDTKYGDTVKISNYSRSNPAVYYENTINYKLDMKLGYYNSLNAFVYLDKDNNADKTLIGQRYITAAITGKNYSNTITFGYNSSTDSYLTSQSVDKTGGVYDLFLPGNNGNTDTIELTFSEDQRDDLFIEPPATPAFNEKLYLEVIATPNLDSYKDLYPLKARICLSKSGQVESVVWRGDFNEVGSDTTGAVTADLDGYNYVIQGVGSGNMRLTWNSNYLELNERFILDDLSNQNISIPTADSEGMKSIVFSVDSNDVSRYDLQFYYTGTETADNYVTWALIKSYVTCEFPYSNE